MALSSKYTRGIEIEIGGNATKLKTALDTANRSIRTTQSELDTLQNSLKLEWDPAKFQRAQELAQRACQQTQEKAEMLRKALESMRDTSAFSDTQKEQYEAIRRELSYVEVAAKKAEEQLEQLNNLRLDKLKQALTDAAGRLDAMGNKLTTGVTLPLTAAGAAAVKYASDAGEAINKVEVAFGSSADAVKAWSETTLTSIGLARGTALDMAALFGDMATSMGYSQDAAADMSMELVNLAADLASFKNISIDQASTALKSIFTGETESLKELGVVMTQANLEAYALAQGYTTAYTAMNQAQQVAVRYQYVLANTKNAQGDFARTSESTANQLRIFQESLKEAAATAGDELLPIITPMIARLNELIQSFGELDEGTKQAAVQAALFLATLGPMLKLTGGVTTAVTAGIEVYKALKTALTAATAAQTGLNVAMSANPVGALVTAVGTLVAVLGSFVISAALTTERTAQLSDEIADARSEYEALSQEISQTQTDTMSMVMALQQLVEQENKTAAQKQTILKMVEQLNEAIPDLTLHYDQQTDSLNLTTEAIRSLSEAEYDRQQQQAAVERLTEAYQEQIAIAEELTDAEETLQEAKERFAAFDGAEERTARENVSLDAAKGALIAAQGEYERLTALQEENQAEISKLEREYGAFNSTAGKTGKVLEETGTAADSASQQLAALNSVLSRNQGAYELLAQAQQQQSETGYLELDTVVKLLEEYPQLSGYLITSANGYQLADGALQAYIATQRTEYALALNEAQRAADAIVQAETEKINAIGATTMTAKQQLMALAELYQSMGANADNLAEGVSYYAKANEYRAAAQAITDATDALENFDRVSASVFRESVGTTRRTSSGSDDSSSTKQTGQDPAQTDMEELQAWLDDMDHQIFLWSKDESKTQAIVDLYQTMMDRLHKQAQQFRSQGYGDTSDQIQELQTLWWGYAEERERVQTEAEENAAAAKQEAYQTELDDLKYFLDMDIISEETYYRELARLRDTYLEENSDAWRQANVDLHDYLERCRQEQLEAAKEAYEAQVAALESAMEEEKAALKDRYEAEKEAAKEAYEARKAQIEAELAAEKERLNVVLDGIDAEIQARKELREDQEQDDAISQAQKRLEAAQAQLAFARTEEDRAQWEKEVIRLQEALDKAIQDKEDTLFYREKEEEKEQAQAQIDAAEEAAADAKEQAEADYQAALERLEAEYDAAVKELENRYERAISAAKSAYESAAANLRNTASGGVDSQTMSHESLNNNGNPDAPYYAGASELAGAVRSAAASSQQSIVNSKTTQVSITYQVTGGLTEGQIARTVAKVVDQLDR